VPPPWRPPPEELQVGVGRYATPTAGTGGRIKVDPEDFRVDEISLYPFPDPEGAFTVLRVSARNWEQHELAHRLSDRLHLAPGAIAWAGTKDRRAITEQLLSYRGPPAELGEEPLPGVTVRETYRARSGLVLGHHFGNSFSIAVRESPLSPEPLAERVAATARALREVGELPNFFGPQRFGEVRPVTHEVGRALLRGDSASAVEIYLASVYGGESEEGRNARVAYASHHDPVRALREFPPAYRFERTLLDNLARGRGPARALHALPRELRRLFIHAYQSLLFNRFLSARYDEGLSLRSPEPGDFLLRGMRDGTVPGTNPIPVTEDNLPEALELVERGRARLAGPLVGLDTPPFAGRPGELLTRLLAAEGIEREAFRLREHPDLASEGTFRPLAFPVPPLGVQTLAEPPNAYRLTFALPKGTYATVLVREFVKAGAGETGDPVTARPLSSKQA
jgi:tRNA pseudouridine13 synthase